MDDIKPSASPNIHWKKGCFRVLKGTRNIFNIPQNYHQSWTVEVETVCYWKCAADEHSHRNQLVMPLFDRKVHPQLKRTSPKYFVRLIRSTLQHPGELDSHVLQKSLTKKTCSEPTAPLVEIYNPPPPRKLTLTMEQTTILSCICYVKNIFIWWFSITNVSLLEGNKIFLVTKAAASNPCTALDGATWSSSSSSPRSFCTCQGEVLELWKQKPYDIPFLNWLV